VHDDVGGTHGGACCTRATWPSRLTSYTAAGERGENVLVGCREGGMPKLLAERGALAWW